MFSGQINTREAGLRLHVPLCYLLAGLILVCVLCGGLAYCLHCSFGPLWSSSVVIDTLIYSTTSYALHAMAHEVACASLVVLGTVVEADESSSMTMSTFRPEIQVRDGNGYVDEYEGDITQSSLLASLGVNNCSTNGDFASAGREISVGVGEAGTQRGAPGTLLLPNRPHEGLMCHPQSMLVGGVIGHDLAARSAIDIVAPLRSREVELTSHLGPSPVARVGLI